MKLHNPGSNQTILIFGNNKIFFSYETPVVCRIGNKWYKTSKYWTNTTSSHINSYFRTRGINNIIEKDQSFFDDLLNNLKVFVNI